MILFYMLHTSIVDITDAWNVQQDSILSISHNQNRDYTKCLLLF